MPKCHKFYPNCQWTVTHCWPNLTLETVLLTKVYWSYSTNVVRVCFTPLIKPTLTQDLKRKSNVPITFKPSAMASLMNFCATILLKISIQLWTNSLLLFILHDLHFLQQFPPPYPNQPMIISTIPKFYNIIISQKMECAIPIN